jgi:predicted hotdog family 3-hydroxylacyl-ACP dehydratase
MDAVTLALDRAAIAALLPHQGAMCLLDGVLEHDEAHIVCISSRHRDPAHPLAADGRLSPVVAIELAAQAMALHGALAGGGAAGTMHGRLARVRDCVLECDRMDVLTAPLVVEAVRIAGGARALSYRFSVRAGRDGVASGTVLVALTPVDA